MLQHHLHHHGHRVGLVGQGVHRHPKVKQAVAAIVLQQADEKENIDVLYNVTIYYNC